MASIAKLAIRGVRSFSPDDDEQVIEFFFPCTMIVGANGCGKTTIIEALKYAVTGSLPPGGAKSGQAFVHDPKSYGHSVIKASVKLRFTNLAGAPMLVVRSMELTQRKSTMNFKALDGVLKTTDAKTGERVSLSHKCTELDRQIPMLLGVSRPILENVVFCHQEDSSWPLMEGAVLKKRFDDIFDSARYAKALEAIRKLGTDYKSKVKDLKADVSALSAHKHAAKDYRNDLERVAEQMEQLEEHVEAGKKELTRAEQEVERCKEVLMQTDEARQEIDLRQNELTTEKSVVESQRSMLEEDLTKKHTVAELEDMLRDFDDQRSTLGDEKQRVERRCQALRHDMQQLRDDQLRLNSQVGKLTAAKETHEHTLKQRLTLMEHMARKYGIDLNVTPTQLNQSATMNASFAAGMSQAGTSFLSQAGDNTMTQDTSMTLSDDDMDAFYRALEDKEKELKDNLSSQRDSNQAQEDQLQRVLSEILGKKAAIENARAKVQKEYGEASRELQQLANTTRTSRVREGEITDKRKEAENYAKQRDDLINKGRREEIETNIKQLERKIEDIKLGIARDNEALQYLRGRVEKQSEISMLREQTAEELSGFKLKLDATRFDFRQCNIDVPAVELDDEIDGRELVDAMQRLVESVETKHRRTRIELEKVDSDLSYAQQAFSEKSAQLNHNQQTADTLRRRMDALESNNGGVGVVKRMMSENRTLVPDGLDITKPQQILTFFDQKLQQVDSELEKVDTKPENVINGLLKVSRATREMENGEEVEYCPCCTRKMVANEVDIFKKTMNEMLDPEKSPLLKATQAKARALRTQKVTLNSLKKVVSDNMNDLLDFNRCVEESSKLASINPNLKRDVGTFQVQLSNSKDSRERLTMEVETLRKLMDTANALWQDASRISAKKSDVEEKLKDEETNVGTGSFLDTRSLATVEKELFERLKKKDQLSDEISNLNKEMSDLNNEITSLTTKASNLDKRVRELEQMLSKSQEEAKRKDTLIAKVGACEEEEKKLRAEMTAIQQKLDGKETEKRRFRATVKDEEEVLSQTLAKFSTDFSELKSLNSQIVRYTDSNQSDQFGSISTEIASIESKIKDKEDDLRKAEPTLESLTRRMNDQERHKKNLSANIAILKSERRIIDIEKEVAKLRGELDGKQGLETAEADLERADKRKLELTKDIAGYEGQRREILDQLRSLKRKLDTEEYKNIDERHRRAAIMYETTNIAVSDLEKYHSALDKALLRYHGIKVQEINKIIRELWALTYKGEDISSIELVTSQEGASKRSYNYRVVMTKGTTQMDMRGRCSAGQRVLASIVIRLALAETFCLNFGCLALDEPTTNLDHNNKKGLATALAQIISARARQSNFQLVIITHDEDFVSMFKTELSSQTGFDMPEKYFQVRREEGSDGKFYSKIDAIDWDELL